MADRQEAIYAAYKGDEFLGMGTAEELGQKLGVKPDTIRWYTYPSARRRSRPDGMAVEKVV